MKDGEINERNGMDRERGRKRKWKGGTNGRPAEGK
jgi:hypothetical protein